MTYETALLLQLIASAAMTGIIWIVQLAIYPLFALLEGPTFQRYHDRYTSLVTFVIAPTMFLEVATCLWCLYLGNWLTLLAPTILLALNWASTAFIQVPQHSALTPESVPQLVRGNWIRTIAWSLRTILLALLLRPTLP